MSRPWDFDEARAKCWEASQRQEAAEAALKQTYRDSAMAEEAYRVALADRILELRSEGMAATACGDVARGDRKVADLKRKRDIAEGVREAMNQAAWRLTADRKDAQRFSDWSHHRRTADGQGCVERLHPVERILEER